MIACLKAFIISKIRMKSLRYNINKKLINLLMQFRKFKKMLEFFFKKNLNKF